MDLTTRLHNNTGHHVTVGLLDHLQLLLQPRQPIKPGGTTDLGRRIGFSDTNSQLRHMLVSAETESGLRLSAVIMPIHVFLNSDIYLSSSIDPITGGEMIRVAYRTAAGSIQRLRMVRWAKDLGAYLGAIFGANSTSSIV